MKGLRAALGVDWVKVEDDGGEMVFHPADSVTTLSRAPRDRVRLLPDGTAHLAMLPAPSDRPTQMEGTWTEDEHGVVVRAADGRTFRVGTIAAGRMTLHPL